MDLGDQARCWLKIDVQGFELPVLSGASELLRRTVVLEIELSFRPLYKDQAPLHFMLQRLDELKFDVVDLNPVFEDSRNGDLLQVDALLRKRRRA